MYVKELSINVVCDFKFYPHIICDDNRTLWQIEHFKSKKVRPLKKIIFNSHCNAYRINSLRVSRNRLLKFRVDNNYKIILIEGVEYPF